MDKQTVIESNKVSESDTGSTEVQVGLLTERIKSLTAHLKEHHHDNHTRYGMMKMISMRKRLLKYLKTSSPNRYFALIKKLGLRR